MLLAPENVIVAAGIVNVPVVVLTVKPLIVLFVKACDVERSTSVTVPAGIVAFVVLVAVRVNPNAPDVVNDDAVVNVPPSAIFPAREMLLSAFCIFKVNVLAALRTGFDVAVIATLNAAEVSLSENVVSAVMLPPEIVGDVARTTLPEPVDDVKDVDVFAVPLPVEVKNDG